MSQYQHYRAVALAYTRQLRHLIAQGRYSTMARGAIKYAQHDMVAARACRGEHV